MTTIDHRILIPAAPDVVWDFLSDITRNPQWQVDCFEVIFLTSKREGPGLRWRYSTPHGNEYVIAVTAWYEGLGYEYYFVDGVPFRENKGRIRLQEIPEGTIVQWTFTYELGGIFGGMRNALGMNRQINHTIADSLKSLWQQIKDAAGGRSHEAKSLMRDAPDVEARSAYRPRHPSAVAEQHEQAEPQGDLLSASIAAEPPVHEGDGQSIHVIAEPPISDEDTRQRRAVEPATAIPELEADVPFADIPADLNEEPDFLVDLSRFEPPRHPSDTQPRRPVTPEAEAEPVSPIEADEPGAAQVDTVEPLEAHAEPAASTEETEPLTFRPPEVLPDYLPSAESFQPEVTKPAFETEVTPLEPSETVSAASFGEVAPLITEPRLTDEDTRSIWERFGVPRPSEIGQTEAVSGSVTPEAQPEPEISVSAVPPTPHVKIVLPDAPMRTGLRIVLRHKLIRLRHPSAKP